MINTEAIDDMLKELDRCQKKISMVENNIALIESGQVDHLTNIDEVIEMLELFLEKEKGAARFIHDLLAMEYEHVDVEPILQQLFV